MENIREVLRDRKIPLSRIAKIIWPGVKPGRKQDLIFMVLTDQRTDHHNIKATALDLIEDHDRKKREEAQEDEINERLRRLLSPSSPYDMADNKPIISNR